MRAHHSLICYLELLWGLSLSLFPSPVWSLQRGRFRAGGLPTWNLRASKGVFQEERPSEAGPSDLAGSSALSSAAFS